MIEFVIDATQYTTYQTCPLLWYERYIRGLQVQYTKGQRDDALALGSLAHSGYANWHLHKQPIIDEKLISEIGPTPECLNLAKSIVQEHARIYCDDEFEVLKVEEQIIVPVCVRTIGAQEIAICISAKLDTIGRAPKAMSINGGASDSPVNVSAGVFSFESKTKAAEISRAAWIKRWQIAKQAVFQTLALQYKYGASACAEPTVLLNVAEKPRTYVPVRKCKAQNGCGNKVAVRDWILDAASKYRCPNCGVVQDIEMPKPEDMEPAKPVLFRTVAALTPEQIELGRQQIVEVVIEMAEIVHGSRAARMREDNCVDRFGRWACDYFDFHVQGHLGEEGNKLAFVPDPRAYMHSEN